MFDFLEKFIQGINLKICFLSLNSYPTLARKNLGYVGGAEVEQVTLAREMVSQGFEVCFVTYNYSRGKMEKINKIEIIPSYSRDGSNKINILKKYRTLLASLRKANANIYFHEAGSYGVLPISCFLNRRKFIHRIASDAIVQGKSLYSRYGFGEKLRDQIEIKQAHAVICQSLFQKRLLIERFGIESIIIKNGLELPKKMSEKSIPIIVLWVGSLSNIKNPKLFVEIAKLLPNIQFEMVGGSVGDCQIDDYILQSVKNLSNFKYAGFVPYSEVNSYFERASIFVSTSSVEGFPNTFIQAWAHNVPVVSLNIDPDQVIQKEQIGFFSGTFEQLLKDVTTLVEDEQLREKMGKKGRIYVEREHDIHEVVKRYTVIFADLLKCNKENY